MGSNAHYLFKNFLIKKNKTMLYLQESCMCSLKRMQKLWLRTCRRGIFLLSLTTPTWSLQINLWCISGGPPRRSRLHLQNYCCCHLLFWVFFCNVILFLCLCRWSLPLWLLEWALTRLMCDLLSITPSANLLRIIIRRVDVQVGIILILLC